MIYGYMTTYADALLHSTIQWMFWKVSSRWLLPGEADAGMLFGLR